MTRKNKASPYPAGEPMLPDVYLNRELSQLAFNRRVLAQAEDPRVPLLERLRYLCIVSSNMDEFFEVRIASLLARMDGHTSDAAVSGAGLEHTNGESHDIVERQYAILTRKFCRNCRATAYTCCATRTAMKRSAHG